MGVGVVMDQATTFHVLGACGVGGITLLAAAVIAHIARHEPAADPDSTDNPAERSTQ